MGCDCSKTNKKEPVLQQEAKYNIEQSQKSIKSSLTKPIIQKNINLELDENCYRFSENTATFISYVSNDVDKYKCKEFTIELVRTSRSGGHLNSST